MNIPDKIQENVELAPLTTFRIGGRARYFAVAQEREDLPALAAWARQNQQKIFVLGGGSNVVVNDAGIDGLVVRIGNKDLAVKGERLEAGAGAGLGSAVSAATAAELGGLAWAAGIPGTVGGAIRGNAGAYGGRMSDIIETVEVFDMAKGEYDLLSRNLCRFGYRTSLIKENRALAAWSVVFRLRKGAKDDIISEINDILGKRRLSNPSLPSAGCVFKNLSIKDVEAVNPELAQAARSEGAVKGEMLGAGWVINQADLRGHKVGPAKISLEHANFIVNTGGARAEDIAIMASLVKQQVRDKFGIQLAEEIEYFGF